MIEAKTKYVPTPFYHLLTYTGSDCNKKRLEALEQQNEMLYPRLKVILLLKEFSF